jgi:uncharacterized damage-inducible protein DinB
MTTANFRQLADYNRWANLRLYGAALEMPDEAYRLPTGFSSAAFMARSITCC